MDIVLRLDEDQEARLVGAAERAGQPVQTFVATLIDDALGRLDRRAALLDRIVVEDGELLRRLSET